MRPVILQYPFSSITARSPVWSHTRPSSCSRSVAAVAAADLPGGGGYPLLRQCVVEAMDAGVMRRADPDLVSHFLWATVHGVVTLGLACRLAGCEGCRCEEGDVSPMDLFHAFGPLIRHGLEAPAAQGVRP